MLRIKKINASLGKRVYTDVGDYFGEVEEAILSENKVDSWRIRVAREVVAQLNGARGVIIPHQFVKAVGDVLIINQGSLPIMAEQPAESEEIPEEQTVDLSEGTVNIESA
jgi:sporulation protein YlmC with PRC-barrel domain